MNFKMNIVNLLIIVVVVAFITTNVWCSCSGGIREGFHSAVDIAGSALNYSMGKGVPVSWENTQINKPDWYGHLETNVGGKVPLPENKMFMFYDNKFDPSCCPSTYTNSSGCVCLSSEQAKYLNTRGGNRTSASIY
jgi:hypothetical protein